MTITSSCHEIILVAYVGIEPTLSSTEHWGIIHYTRVHVSWFLDRIDNLYRHEWYLVRTAH